MNLLRTLVFGGQVSLTVADTTELVKEAARRHGLRGGSLITLGKALSAMTFMSACLKERVGEISLSVQSDGAGGNLGVSGNRELHMRGYIENICAFGGERECLGENGALTIVRDDGYNRPFVGSCALAQSVDESFEAYYKISEQLPTRLATAVETDENGACVFAGVIALQPLPFADDTALSKTAEARLGEWLAQLRGEDLASFVRARFDGDERVWELRNASYHCHCSRAYLQKVLASVGRAEFLRIVEEDGAVRVHCHYCNTDYAFDKRDEKEIFG